jgi:hypothetical protein
MIETLAISGYRFLRDLLFPLDQCQIGVSLEQAANCRRLHLEKSFGETLLAGVAALCAI